MLSVSLKSEVYHSQDIFILKISNLRKTLIIENMVISTMPSSFYKQGNMVMQYKLLQQ